jgi:CRP-like cAMP-binding protein
MKAHVHTSGFATMATRLDVNDGRKICVQGHRHQQFGRVVSGRARVERDGVPVATIGVGDHFGEFTLLRGLPSPVTIVAEGPMTIDLVTGSEFRATVAQDPMAVSELERTLDARIRDWVSAPDTAAVTEAAIA